MTDEKSIIHPIGHTKSTKKVLRMSDAHVSGMRHFFQMNAIAGYLIMRFQFQVLLGKSYHRNRLMEMR